jgi:hypothetical protein
MPMHANLDRNNMMWQANLQRRNKTAASADVMWGYPKTASEAPNAPPGCFLGDVINSNAAFTDIFLPAKPEGFT